jgi:uncharacterized protein YcbX
MSNRKPLFTDRKTSPGHRKMPVAQSTAGKLYRVRDKNWVKVWDEGLTWEAANKLKNQVAAKQLSRTVRVEDMAIPAPPRAGEPDDSEIAAAQRNALATVRKTLPKGKTKQPARIEPWRGPLDASLDAGLAQEAAFLEETSDRELSDLVADLGAEPSDEDIDHALRSSDGQVGKI